MRFLGSLACFAAVALGSAPPAAGSGMWPWPVAGEVITPYRNGGDPYAAGMHRGIDIAAHTGARVVAAAGGTVTWAGVAGSSGLAVAVDTGALTTTYLHLSSLSVARGARVAPGDRLGAVGTSGTRSAVAPHLHFGVRESGSDHGYRDPLGYLRPLAPPGSPERRPAPAPPPAVPVPAPAPAAPAPAPAAPAGPAPARVPIRAPLPDPRRVPVRVGRPGRRAATRPPGLPAPRAPRVAVRAPTAAGEPRRARARAPHHSSGPPSVAVEHGDRPARARPRPEGHRAPAVARWPLLLAAAGLLLAASSIGRSWPSTSQRPSTTRTASRTSVMRTRRSRPT